MSYEDETMVEEGFDAEADDTLPDDVEEEEPDDSEDLSSITGEDEEEPAEEPEEQSTSEPGWIKQRVNKAVQKAVAETERRMRAEFDQQMAPIREKMLNDEARELVRQGEFKSLERAKEYLQLKQGQQPTAPVEQKQDRPRNEQGQFVPKEDPATTARIDMLAHQANRIKEKTGIDVIAEFNNNEEVKRAIIDGEKDFYEVAEELQAQKERGGRRPPSPMRSANGASNTRVNAIESMSDEQFARLEQRIREGARYSLK